MDYEQLLQKYMTHVVSCEGITFVGLIDKDSPAFTSEELEVLQRMTDKAREVLE